jgi:hypothetical protein
MKIHFQAAWAHFKQGMKEVIKKYADSSTNTPERRNQGMMPRPPKGMMKPMSTSKGGIKGGTKKGGGKGKGC